MRTDDEIDDEIEDSIDDDLTIVDESLGSFDDPDLEALTEEFDFFKVSCRGGCGTFSIDEVSVLRIDLTRGVAEFRCPVCNDMQTGSLLVLD